MSILHRQALMPFQSAIPGGLSEGKTLTIEGLVHNDCKRFAVNFICFNNDVAFHFNPRFDKDNIACNTKLSNQWGLEERTDHMLFGHNEAFEITITVLRSAFKVSVNGDHILEYRHRISYQGIQSLQLNGDITLNKVTFSDPPSQISTAPEKQLSVAPNYSIPFQSAIPGRISDGKTVTIEGLVHSDCNRFTVNFLCFNNDTAFHFNPRFDEDNTIVCNTKLDNKWGSVERTQLMPFEKDDSFEIIIIIMEHVFQVSVNRKRILEYHHRVSYQGIQSVLVKGDITLLNVTFSEPPAQESPVLSPYSVTPSHLKPFQCAILGGISDGKTVTIEGLVHSGCKRFAVNFLCFNNDIAFYFNPRLDDGNVIVCNTKLGDKWGKVVRIPNMPFSEEEPFQIAITVLEHMFEVSVNGDNVLEYRHRVSYQAIKSLYINGDVTLTNVTFSEP
uniref:Galectin n=1 Tax=Xenopus tropicalis TaxID=8364 RepID=F6V0F6_XENTR